MTNRVRITIIEADNIDSDAQFGLVRAIGDLLARAKPSATVVTEAEPASATAPTVAPEPIIDGEFPEVDEPEPARPRATKSSGVASEPSRSESEIDDAVVQTLLLEPSIDLKALAGRIYGSDRHAGVKLHHRLKRLAHEGRVERLSASTWRALSELEQLDRGGDLDDEESDDDGEDES